MLTWSMLELRFSANRPDRRTTRISRVKTKNMGWGPSVDVHLLLSNCTRRRPTQIRAASVHITITCSLIRLRHSISLFLCALTRIRSVSFLFLMGRKLVEALGPGYLVGSVFDSLSCLTQRRGFDPLLRRFFSGKGFFSLGVNTGADSPPPPPPPPNFLVESINTCIPSHGLKRSRHSWSRRANACNKNTPSMHRPRRRNVTTSMVGLKNSHIRKNLTQNSEPQRYIAGERRRRGRR